jgi:hypothetical protein
MQASAGTMTTPRAIMSVRRVSSMRTPGAPGANAKAAAVVHTQKASLSGGVAELRGTAGAAAAAAARMTTLAVVRDSDGGDAPSYSQRREGGHEGGRGGRGGGFAGSRGSGGRGGGGRGGGGFRGRGGRGRGGDGGAVGEMGRGGRIQGDLTAATHPKDILAIVDADGDAFDAIHTATAIHRLATHAPRRTGASDEVVYDKRFRALMELVNQNLKGMNAQGLANVAWACARLEHNPGVDVLNDIAVGLERELAAAAGNTNNNNDNRGGGGNRRNAREVRPQAVSNTIWAFGQLRYKPDDATLASLCRSAIPTLRQFRAQEITNTLLGVAHMEHDPGRAFADAAFDSVRVNLQSFQGKGCTS